MSTDAPSKILPVRIPPRIHFSQSFIDSHFATIESVAFLSVKKGKREKRREKEGSNHFLSVYTLRELDMNSFCTKVNTSVKVKKIVGMRFLRSCPCYLVTF
jgi:hypothetical protein